MFEFRYFLALCRNTWTRRSSLLATKPLSFKSNYTPRQKSRNNSYITIFIIFDRKNQWFLMVFSKVRQNLIFTTVDDLVKLAIPSPPLILVSLHIRKQAAPTTHLQVSKGERGWAFLRFRKLSFNEKVLKFAKSGKNRKS